MENLHPRTGANQFHQTRNELLTLANIEQVKEITGLSKSTIYRLMNEEKFPRPLRLSPQRVAWRIVDIEKWLAQLSPTSGGFYNVKN